MSPPNNSNRRDQDGQRTRELQFIEQRHRYVTDVRTRDVTNDGRCCGIDAATHTLPTRATDADATRSCRFSMTRKVNATRDRPTDTVARAILPLTTRPRSARVDPVARATSRRCRYSSRRISAPSSRRVPLPFPSSSLGGYLQIRRPVWYIFCTYVSEDVLQLEKVW